VSREDLELLTELAQLNNAMTSLALRIMDGSATVGEQRDYAQRLIAAGRRLCCRADEMECLVIDGEATEIAVTLFPRQWPDGVGVIGS
jgi:hypothetical protein